MNSPSILGFRTRVTVLFTTFNNISAMSWLSFLLWEETEVSAQNHWPVAIHWKTLSYNAPSHTPRHDLIDGFLVFNATFSNISAIECMATSFSDGRSRSTRREPPTMSKQLVSFTTCGCESSASFFVIYKAGREPTPYWW